MKRLKLVLNTDEDPRTGVIVDTRTDTTRYYVGYVHTVDDLPYRLVDPVAETVIARASSHDELLQVAEQHFEMEGLTDAWDGSEEEERRGGPDGKGGYVVDDAVDTYDPEGGR